MQTKDLSPKAEPIAWATGIALLLGAIASYGLSITPELKELILYVGPLVAAAVWARFRVYAPDSVQELKRERYEAGLADAQPVSGSSKIEAGFHGTNAFISHGPGVRPRERIGRQTNPGS